MRLITRQIDAVRKAKERCIEEAENGERHLWNANKCVLCEEFNRGFCPADCLGCPLDLFATSSSLGCTSLSKIIFEYSFNSNNQELAEILYCIELQLKEERLDQIQNAQFNTTIRNSVREAV